jgi:hypothetical protein
MYAAESVSIEDGESHSTQYKLNGDFFNNSICSDQPFVDLKNFFPA